MLAPRGAMERRILSYRLPPCYRRAGPCVALFKPYSTALVHCQATSLSPRHRQARFLTFPSGCCELLEQPRASHGVAGFLTVCLLLTDTALRQCPPPHTRVTIRSGCPMRRMR